MQYNRLSHEDPNWQIANFLKICDTFKHNKITRDISCLRLFPFPLRDKAKICLNYVAPGAITTWDKLAHRLLEKYFLPNKIDKLRDDNTTFS